MKVPPPWRVSWNLPVHSSRLRGEDEPKAELRLGLADLVRVRVRVRVGVGVRVRAGVRVRVRAGR